MLRRTVVRAWHVEPAWLLSLGLAATCFSGQWRRLGLALPLDRILVVAAFALVLARAGNSPTLPHIPLRRVHLLLLAVLCYAFASAFWVHTLGETSGKFGIIDRLGLVPFLAYFVAPSAFATRRQRDILLGVMVVLGAYLGFTALVEGVKLHALVWPQYILDKTIGIHAGRSRGPFLEAEANGLAMIACGAAAAVALGRWRDRVARTGAWVVIGLCAAGALLTYTRQIWLGAALGTIVALAVLPRLRWRLVPLLAVGTGALVFAVVLVPGLGHDLSDRYHDTKPSWTRKNTAQAALNMIAERPLTGFGWATFKKYGPDHFDTLPDVPVRGQQEEVHNVFLSRASELGLVGGGLWLVAVLLALGGPAIRTLSGDLEMWRGAYLAMLVAYVTAAMLSPLTALFPGLVVWMWAGILAGRQADPVPA